MQGDRSSFYSRGARYWLHRYTIKKFIEASKTHDAQDDDCSVTGMPLNVREYSM
jgi:hypothetical protein